MNDRAYKEQSVATTSDFAAPIPGDDPTVARLIRPLLANTRLETAQLRCAKSSCQTLSVCTVPGPGQSMVMRK